MKISVAALFLKKFKSPASKSRALGFKYLIRIRERERNSYSKTDPDATFMRMKVWVSMLKIYNG